MLAEMLVLAAFGGYVLSSLVLMKFPSLLHKRKQHKFKAVHISHRGGAGENLENTLTAFQHAVTMGTEMLEIDCHITKDGEVVVSHDEHLKRGTGQEVRVSELLYKDLPSLKGSLRLDFGHDHVTVGGEDRQIPLLKDVFEKFPSVAINIDIKVDNDELIRKVSLLCKEYNREALTVWGSRMNHVTEKCFKQNPNIMLLFSLRRVLMAVVLFYTGLLPFIPLKEGFYEIIMPSILLREGKFASAFDSRFQIVAKIFDFLLMSKQMISHLKARGIQTYLWVLNEEEDFQRAYELGATGVMTDFPTKLKDFLDKNPQFRNGKV